MRCLAYSMFVVLAGCGGPSAPDSSEFGPEADYSRYEAFADEIRDAGAPVLYEGLPSDFGEEELLAPELAKNKHQVIEGEPFYKATLTLSEEDAKTLTEMMSGSAVPVPYGGPKACGPFHADYALEWTVGNKKRFAMICFSCHEVIALGPKGKALTDLSDAGAKELERILFNYHGQRPRAFNYAIGGLRDSLVSAESVLVHKRQSGSTEKVGGVQMSRAIGKLKDDDRNEISELILNPKSFKSHTAKKCKFNPDYGLKWMNEFGDEHDALLVCLTCSEVKFYFGEDEYRLDLADQAKETFERLLAKYK